MHAILARNIKLLPIAAAALMLGAVSSSFDQISPQWKIMLLAFAAIFMALWLVAEAEKVLIGVVILSQIVVLDFHFEDFGGRYFGNPPGYQVSLVGILALVLAFLMMNAGRTSRIAPHHPVVIGLYWVLMGFVLFSLSGINSGEHYLMSVINIGLFTLFYFGVTFVLSSPRNLRFAIKVLLILLIVQGGLGIMQAAFKSPLGLKFLGAASRLQIFGAERALRSFGTQPSANAFGWMLAGFLPLAFVLSTSNEHGLRRYALLASVFGGLALFLSYSRGSWMAFALAVVAGLFVIDRRSRIDLRKLLALVGLALFAGLLFFFFRETILTRLQDVKAAYSRLPMIEHAWKVIQDHPLAGVGLNQYELAVPDRPFGMPVHSMPFMVAAECGIGAALAFLALVGWYVLKAMHAARSTDAFVSRVAVGVAAGLIGFLVVSMKEPMSLGSTRAGNLAFLLALSSVVWNLHIRSALAQTDSPLGSASTADRDR